MKDQVMKSPESPSLPGAEDIVVKTALQRKSSQKEESKQNHNTERQLFSKTKRYSANKLQNHTFLDTKSKKSCDKYPFTDNYDALAYRQQQPSRIHKDGEQRKAYFHQFSSKRVLPAIGCTFAETDDTGNRRQKSPLNALQDSSNHHEDNGHIQNLAANKENTHHRITEEVDRLKEEYRRMEQKLKDSEASEERWKAEAKKWKLLAAMDKSTDDDPRSKSSCSLLHSHEAITSPVPNTDISPRQSSPSFQLHKNEPPDITENLSKTEDNQNQNVNGSHVIMGKEQLDRNIVKDNVRNLPFNMSGSRKLEFTRTYNKHNQNLAGYGNVSDKGIFHAKDDQSLYSKNSLCPAESSLCPWGLRSHATSKDHLFNKPSFRFCDSTSDFFQDTLFDVQTNNAISFDRFQSQTNHFNDQPLYNEAEMEYIDLPASDAPFSRYRSNEMEDANDHYNGNNNNTIFLRLNIDF